MPALGAAVSYVYDGNGSRTSSTVAASGTDPAVTTSYGYTATGALASVTTPTTTVEYTVDGRGLRQSRTAAGSTDDFVWSTVGGLPLLLDDGDHAYLYGPSLTPVAQVDDAGTVEYLHADQLGSVRTITDASGVLVSTNTFDAFGARTAHTGTGDSAFGFTGNWTDPDTGLVHLRARDYDPATGQFLTVDPAVDSTRQPYAYTGNSPLNRTDPSGLDFWSDAQDFAADARDFVVGAAQFVRDHTQCALEQVGAFALGALDSLTFGLSSVVLGAVPGYNEFVAGHEAAFTAGGVTVTVIQIAIAIVTTAGVGIALIAVKVAAKAALKSGAKAAERAVVRNLDELPTVVFSRTRAPGLAKNFDNAVANGAPTQLTRASARTRDANRRTALARQDAPPPGQSLDKYPFASSVQGGNGATVRAVPRGEQDYQGRVEHVLQEQQHRGRRFLQCSVWSLVEALGSALAGIERGLELLGRRRLLDQLRSGLALEVVESVLRSHSLPNHPGIEKLYEWRDGTTTGGGPLGEIYIFPGYYFLSLEDAIANYEAFVGDFRWQYGWFPVFANGGGDFYFIDLNDEGFGKVRHFRIEESESPVEFLSIEDMMTTFATAFERGAFFVDQSSFLEMDDLAFEAIALELNPHVPWWAD